MRPSTAPVGERKGHRDYCHVTMFVCRHPPFAPTSPCLVVKGAAGKEVGRLLGWHSCCRADGRADGRARCVLRGPFCLLCLFSFSLVLLVLLCL